MVNKPPGKGTTSQETQSKIFTKVYQYGTLGMFPNCMLLMRLSQNRLATELRRCCHSSHVRYLFAWRQIDTTEASLRSKITLPTDIHYNTLFLKPIFLFKTCHAVQMISVCNLRPKSSAMRPLLRYKLWIGTILAYPLASIPPMDVQVILYSMPLF